MKILDSLVTNILDTLHWNPFIDWNLHIGFPMYAGLPLLEFLYFPNSLHWNPFVVWIPYSGILLKTRLSILESIFIFCLFTGIYTFTRFSTMESRILSAEVPL
jgi:hypothetical protein